MKYLSKFGVKVLCYGYKKEFIDRFNANEILIKNGMTSELIAKEVLENLK
jgi:deoxyxylulose-5-phosphate synthase